MKKLMAILAPVILVGSLAYMAFAQPKIPLLDANRTVLAETYLEAFCAGDAFLKTRGNGNDALAADCRELHEGRHDDEPDYERVQSAFCMGIVMAGWPGYVGDCVSLLQEQKLWPTLDGALTNTWNRRFPYPLEGSITDVEQQSDSRTGDRENNDREGIPTRP